MHLLCVGISHKTAPVELREKIAFNEQAVNTALADLDALYGGAEFALVSTCNRTELYAARPVHGEPTVEQIVEYFSESRDIPAADLVPAVYHHDNDRAVRHLMRVACGLESMVVGENQIIGQVRDAYQRAQAGGTAGSVLHKVFQSTLSVAKRVRAETGLDAGRLSVSSVAVDFARHLFRSFDDKTVLTIGAGKMTELTLEHFVSLQPRHLLVCNRTPAKAQELAEKHRGRAVGFDRLDDHLVEADVVISSTGATEPIVTAERFKPLLARRKFRPIFVIDIAVPRDFDPAVGQLANVYLYDMDDLQRAIADQASARNGVLAECAAVIEPAAAACYGQIQTGDLTDLIVQLRAHLHELGAAETERTANKIRAASPEEAEKLLAEHTHRLVNKILHRPIAELNRPEGSASAAMYVTALRRLFELEAHPTEPEDQTEDGGA